MRGGWRCGGAAVEEQVASFAKDTLLPQQTMEKDEKTEGKRTKDKKTTTTTTKTKKKTKDKKTKTRKKTKEEEEEEEEDLVRVYSQERRPRAIVLILLSLTSAEVKRDEDCLRRLVELHLERHVSVVLVPNSTRLHGRGALVCRQVGRLLQVADLSCVRVPLYINSSLRSCSLLTELRGMLEFYCPVLHRPQATPRHGDMEWLNKSSRRLLVEPDDDEEDDEEDDGGDTNLLAMTATPQVRRSVLSAASRRLTRLVPRRTVSTPPPPPPPPPPIVEDERAHLFFLRTTAVRFLDAMATDRVVRDKLPAPWMSCGRRRRRVTGWDEEYGQFIDVCILGNEEEDDDEDEDEEVKLSAGSTALSSVLDGQEAVTGSCTLSPRVVEDCQEDGWDEGEFLVDDRKSRLTMFHRWMNLGNFRRRGREAAEDVCWL